MKPTQAQIDAGVAEAKKLMAEYAPRFVQNMVSDEQLTEGITAIVTAALAAGDAA